MKYITFHTIICNFYFRVASTCSICLTPTLLAYLCCVLLSSKLLLCPGFMVNIIPNCTYALLAYYVVPTRFSFFMNELFTGLKRFSDDVEEMLGFRPGLYWRICWKFVSPTFIIVSKIISNVISNYKDRSLLYLIGVEDMFKSTKITLAIFMKQMKN